MLIFYKVVLIHPRSFKRLFNDCVDSSVMVDRNRLRRSCDLHSLLLAASALSQAHVVPLKSCLEIITAKNPPIIAISPTQTQKIHQITIFDKIGRTCIWAFAATEGIKGRGLWRRALGRREWRGRRTRLAVLFTWAPTLSTYQAPTWSR